MTERDYGDYLQDILDSIRDAVEFMEGMTSEDFQKDRKTVSAVLRSLEVMGEATKRIPQSLRDQYPDVPWKKMAGMRDKLIHEYSGVDLGIVWEAVKNDLPPVQNLVRNILKDFNA